LTKAGLSFQEIAGAPGSKPIIAIGDKKMEGFDGKDGLPKLNALLKDAGYSATADPKKVNWVMAEVILVIFLVYVTMVYGPIAAFLVELFPTKIRYTSMSLPITSATAGLAACCPC